MLKLLGIWLGSALVVFGACYAIAVSSIFAASPPSGWYRETPTIAKYEGVRVVSYQEFRRRQNEAADALIRIRITETNLFGLVGIERTWRDMGMLTKGGDSLVVSRLPDVDPEALAAELQKQNVPVTVLRDSRTTDLFGAYLLLLLASGMMATLALRPWRTKVRSSP